MEPRYQISELPKKNEIEEDNKNNSNLPILGEKIINNENPMLENMIILIFQMITIIIMKMRT